MAWRRLGRVYVPSGEAPWLVSHASVPFAEPLGGGLHRIWFSPRDAANRSHVAWLVLDVERPGRVIEMAPAPALGCGPPGAHDDCGAMMSWLAGPRLYYIGWTTRSTVPFHVSIGAAEGPGEWRRAAGPVMDRTLEDPWFCSNPCVLREAGAWRMWYLSGLGWEEVGGRWSPLLPYLRRALCRRAALDGARPCRRAAAGRGLCPGAPKRVANGGWLADVVLCSHSYPTVSLGRRRGRGTASIGSARRTSRA